MGGWVRERAERELECQCMCACATVCDSVCVCVNKKAGQRAQAEVCVCVFGGRERGGGGCLNIHKALKGAAIVRVGVLCALAVLLVAGADGAQGRGRARLREE